MPKDFEDKIGFFRWKEILRRLIENVVLIRGGKSGRALQNMVR